MDLHLQKQAFSLDNLPIITLLFTLSVCIFVAKTCLFRKVKKKLPPSPPKLPILGHLHRLGIYPHRSLHALSSCHGDLMLLHLGSCPTLVVSSASAAREINKTHDLIFSNRPESRITRRVFYDHKDLAFSPYGEYWKKMRSIAVLQLLSSKRVRSFQAIIEEETRLMIKKIIQRSEKDEGSCGVNLSDMFVLFTNNVICRVAFGRRYSEGQEGRKFKKLMEELRVVLGIFDVGDFIPWFSWVRYVTGLHQKVERLFTGLDRFLDVVIDDHAAPKTSENDMDFVDVLLNIQKDGSGGASFAGDNIKGILLDAFAGGTDTTFTALEWAMTEILKNPQVLREAQKEIRDIVGANQSIIEGDIERMPYFKAVIKETFRLHPPIPLLVPRECSQDVNIQGFDIAAGTRVIINAWTIGRDPETWEEPNEFRPERFLGSEIDFKGQDFGLIPFGAGRRGCPGTTLATTTIEYALATLLREIDWTLPDSAKAQDLDMSESVGLSIQKKIPLLVVPIPLPS